VGFAVDDQLSENLEELRANYQNKRAEIRERQERASRITSIARSRDGLVSLQVGPQGQLLGLSLNPGVYDRLSPQRLAAALMELAKTATADATEQVREIMAPVMPSGVTPAGGDFAGLIPRAPGMLDDEVPPTRPQ
jgi:DNA-binding protein YbaB